MRYIFTNVDTEETQRVHAKTEGCAVTLFIRYLVKMCGLQFRGYRVGSNFVRIHSTDGEQDYIIRKEDE